MKNGWNALKLTGYAFILSLISLTASAGGEKGNHGFYTGIGGQYSMAPHEDRADIYRPEYMTIRTGITDITSPGVSTVNGQLGLHFLEGYRFNHHLAAELSGVLYGQSRDNIGVDVVFSPWRSRDFNDRFSIRGILGYSDGHALPGYGFSFEHFFSPHQAFTASLAMRPTLTYHHVEPDCADVSGTITCSRNLSDAGDRMTVWNLGAGYQYYFDSAHRDASSANRSMFAHVLSLGSGQTVITYPTNYDADPMRHNKWYFDTVDMNLSHGLQFNPFYSLEFSGHYFAYRGDETRKRHLALWSFAHQLNSPSLADGLIKAYAKAGSFYVNHRRGGLNYGVGLELFDGDRSLSFGWERFDFRDATLEPSPHYFYDVLGVKARYVFTKPSIAPNLTLPVTAYQKPKRSLGIYMTFMTGSESAQLDEASDLAHQKLALNGFQGFIGFGYQHSMSNSMDIAYELGLGSSSAVYHAERYSADVYDFTEAGHSSKELSYSLSVLPSWSVEGDGSLYGRMGIVRADWINDLHYGIVNTHNGTTNDVSPVAGHEPLRTNGLVMGIGHWFPISSQLSMAVEYDHTWYRYHDVEAKVDASRVSDERRVNYSDAIFRYKPKDDKFMLGAKYALSPLPQKNPRVSYFNRGLYVALSAERDFHTMKRSSSPYVTTSSDIDADFYVGHAYLDGEGIRATLGYQWMITPKLDVGVEFYQRALNSAYYARHHYINEYWTYEANHSVGGRALLGYVVTPVARAYVHAGVLATEFERYGNQEAEQMNQYEENFKDELLGFSMGLGSELAFSKKIALRLEYSYASYDGLGVGDPRLKSTSRWNYYRFSDDNYSIGIRYSL